MQRGIVCMMQEHMYRIPLCVLTTWERHERPPMQGSSCCRSKNKIYANFTLSNLTCTVASLLLVCLSIFGFSLLLNIQYNNLGDMRWFKMTGSVETVTNEEKCTRAHTHTQTHTLTQWDPCCPAGRLQGESVCCSSPPKMSAGQSSNSSRSSSVICVLWGRCSWWNWMYVEG